MFIGIGPGDLPNLRNSPRNNKRYFIVTDKYSNNYYCARMALLTDLKAVRFDGTK